MLQIKNIHKEFSSQTVLDGIDLEIQDGEFFSLLGPSGCGKTTLLRIIAGLENASSGKLYFDNLRVDTLGPQERPFNMVFQRYALFPHMSVFANIAFGLRIKGMDNQSVLGRVEEALKLVGLWDYRDRKPETLSGGQQQRVALARAVVNRPKMLLLDEPLSALDKKMREHMQVELRNLQRQVGITFIFVTHDQEEALALSDRVAVMNKGRLEQVSSPERLYRSPQTLFVAQFVGDSGSLNGNAQPVAGSKDEAAIAFLDGKYVRGQGKLENAQKAVAVVRPEKVRLEKFNSQTHAASGENMLRGKVKSCTFKSNLTEVQVEVAPKQLIKAFLHNEEQQSSFTPETEVLLHFAFEDTFIFAQN